VAPKCWKRIAVLVNLICVGYQVFAGKGGEGKGKVGEEKKVKNQYSFPMVSQGRDLRKALREENALHLTQCSGNSTLPGDRQTNEARRSGGEKPFGGGGGRENVGPSHRNTK